MAIRFCIILTFTPYVLANCGDGQECQSSDQVVLLQSNKGVTVETDPARIEHEGPLSTADQPMMLEEKESVSEASASAFLSRQLRHPWTPKSIKEIFKETGTDKLSKHGYHRYYEKHLAPYREQPGMRVLEIGADSGISLGAWMCYFKDPAEVAGIAYGVDAEAAHAKACDILPGHCDQLKIFSLDQSDKVALEDMKNKSPEGWDIIIDDGSHKPEHNIISFQYLWEKIRPGGMYVIEDIETSYVDTGKPVYGYSLNGGIGAAPPKNTVEKFKQVVDVVSRKHFSQPDFTVFGGIDKDVSEVSFADGLLFVFKKPSDPEWDSYPKTPVWVRRSDSEATFELYKQKIMAEADPELSRSRMAGAKV